MTPRKTGKDPPKGPSPVGTLIYLMTGLIVWGVQFTAVYGGHVLLCLNTASTWLTGAFVVAATLLAVAVLGAFLVWQDRAAEIFGADGDGEWKANCDRIARVIAVLSIVAILWSGWTVLVLDSCAQAR